VDWGGRPSAGAYFSWQRLAGGSEGHVRVMSGGPGYWVPARCHAMRMKSGAL
jgi:hypothetical protein